MEVNAQLNFLRIPPRKVRLVVDLVRNLPVEKAIAMLPFVSKRAARPILKLLKSALANAENNLHLKKENLYIRTLTADEGPKLKRWKPRAFGRASPILKRSSHVVLVLSEIKPTKKIIKKSKDKETAVKILKPEEVKATLPKKENRDFEQKSGRPSFNFKSIRDKFRRKTGEK